MAWLKEPIDIVEYARLYTTFGEMKGSPKRLIRFTQSKTRYAATWQDESYQAVMYGDPAKLKEWMARKLTEEANLTLEQADVVRPNPVASEP